jgi:RecA-family ATPase
MMLNLAINVASGGNEWHEVAPTFMGNKIKNFGKGVYLSAEDSQGTIHRRLKSITTPEQYERLKENLTLIPLPDAGGVFPIIKQDSGGLHITQAYQDLFDQLREIEGLVLIIFDPLQAMVHADITSDPTAGQYWWTQMAKLCAETQATVIVTHHMRKEGSQTIRTAADARAAMRGSTALVDGARFAFAIWPASTEQNSEWSHALT